MNELRYNPLLGTYTMLAASRNARPTLLNDCPFCPPNNQLPSVYSVRSYDNDFPVLSLHNHGLMNENEVYHSVHAYGKCEVILYSNQHEKHICNHSIDEISDILQHVKNRHIELAKNEKLKYIFYFENKGEEVGVTIHHPHAQLYAYPFVPLKLQVELQQSQKYYKSKKTNLFDAIINQEKTENTRILIESEFFITLIPAFTDFPFGVFIIAKHNNIITFEDFNEVMIADLALHIHKTTSAFERLYNRPFPYMMCVHQAPINDHFKSAYQTYFRFHIEFYPPLRDANRLKYYASSELGAWAAANPCDINQCATMLKNQIQ